MRNHFLFRVSEPPQGRVVGVVVQGPSLGVLERENVLVAPGEWMDRPREPLHLSAYRHHVRAREFHARRRNADLPRFPIHVRPAQSCDLTGSQGSIGAKVQAHFVGRTPG